MTLIKQTKKRLLPFACHSISRPREPAIHPERYPHVVVRPGSVGGISLVAVICWPFVTGLFTGTKPCSAVPTGEGPLASGPFSGSNTENCSSVRANRLGDIGNRGSRAQPSRHLLDPKRAIPHQAAEHREPRNRTANPGPVNRRRGWRSCGVRGPPPRRSSRRPAPS